MNNDLAEVLFDKKLLTKGVELEAMCDCVSLGNVDTVLILGRFVVVNICRDINNCLFFQCNRITDGKSVSIYAASVYKIDGMTPHRFASVYGIKFDGSLKTFSKRRGRIPKIRTIIN